MSGTSHTSYKVYYAMSNHLYRTQDRLRSQEFRNEVMQSKYDNLFDAAFIRSCLREAGVNVYDGVHARIIGLVIYYNLCRLLYKCQTYKGDTIYEETALRALGLIGQMFFQPEDVYKILKLSGQ